VGAPAAGERQALAGHHQIMTTILFGDRIGRQAPLAVACSAAIRDSEQRILLTKRTDNRQWCLPGGHLEAGESVTEGVVREVKEETGLDIEVLRLTGVYSSPHRVLEYTNGARFQIVALNFEARVRGGALAISDETCEFMWCSGRDIEALDIVVSHVERILDTFTGNVAAYVR
jgi:ADP-ribose pyrophosphatase YjhB (NUDIX family)